MIRCFLFGHSPGHPFSVGGLRMATCRRCLRDYEQPTLTPPEVPFIVQSDLNSNHSTSIQMRLPIARPAVIENADPTGIENVDELAVMEASRAAARQEIVRRAIERNEKARQSRSSLRVVGKE